MLYLALGGAAFLVYLWATGKNSVFKRREWRVISSVAALVAFTVAAIEGVRGAWPATLALIVAGLWFAGEARRRGAPKPRPPEAPEMGLEEARRILGVEPGASADEVRAAYTRLMQAVHPDKGGTAGLAAQLNAARDRLLRK